MLELYWLHHMPDGTLESGIQVANRVQWALSWEESGGRWFVRGGDQALLITDSREAARAFLYGMALAYSTMPPHLVDQLEVGVMELLGGEPPIEMPPAVAP